MTQQESYVHANGIDVYYETYGEGPPLLLLHGAWGTGEKQWVDHIQDYAEHFTVYVPDARAHGKSLNPSGIITGQILIDDAKAIIDALNLDHPFISGWSLGAYTALFLAVQYPEIARGTIIGGASHIMEDKEERLAKSKERGIQGPGKVDVEKFKDDFPLYKFVKDFHAEGIESLIRNFSHLTYNPFVRPPVEAYQNIKKSMLLIIGDRDDGTKVEDMTELYNLLPNGEMAVIPNADHSMCRMKADIYSRLVLDFLLRQIQE